MDVDTIYQDRVAIASDMNEHLPILYDLARECFRVCQLVRGNNLATWAFIKGLKENGAECKVLNCIDMGQGNFEEALQVAQHAGVSFQVAKGDTAKLDMPCDVDLLFIDTWHVYGHLRRELEKHHDKVGRFIVLHDTEVDKETSESVRMRADVNKESIESGYPVAEIIRGLAPAVDEFLEKHPQWTLHAHYKNNNGLSVLKKII
jgi:hypothetical protein